jgi:hypothetical protein
MEGVFKIDIFQVCGIPHYLHPYLFPKEIETYEYDF